MTAMPFLRAWPTVPWFRRRGTGWGTVYLMRSRKRPGLFKVGFTTRRTKDRRAELNRVGRDDMKIVLTATMPLARSCERVLLRRLRGGMPGRKRDRRGTEWFWLRRREEIGDIAVLLLDTALAVRRVGRCKGSWPAGKEIRIFNALDRENPRSPQNRPGMTRRPEGHHIRRGNR